MSITKIALIVLFVLLACSIAGCVASTTTPTTTIAETPTTLTLTPSTLRLAEGASIQLSWTVSPAAAVVFSSDDLTVSTVTPEGLVVAIGPGFAEITATAGEAVAVCLVTVIGSYVLTAPKKTIYALGDELSLRGGSIAIYDAEGVLLETVALTTAMVTGWNPALAGEQVVLISYEGLDLGFPVTVLSVKQADCRFDDFIVLTPSPVSGEKIEFALTKADLELLENALDNVYDYQEVDIYAYVTAPSGDVKKVSAFWYQEYREISLGTAVNRNSNLEGTVTILPTDVAIILGYIAENDPQYRLRYLSGESGAFTAKLYVKVDGAVIQTFEKEFTVAADLATDYRGTVIVDETNRRHFAFTEGGSYIPVGQNVAWYTSRDRRYYDYVSWFGKMGDVGMNYARVWMAAWGFSIFWSDVYDYDVRQTNMKSLDHTIELASDNGIYVQLCILHHGMFSENVNPMWPGSDDTWYTDKYGANPYGEILDNPGQFFTSTLAKASFKNQLSYIVARWGYSDHLMAWELFNEVDWIEQYTATSGTAWHREMAEYLKAIDPYGHMVTTSVKGDSFLSSVYNVFDLTAIDYVNVHSYGIYNHTTTLPTRQKNGFLAFQKPILYAEVGYSGNGGVDQMAVDPENVTLHQELWGGMMGAGAGTAMNWWWESWIHPSDAYGAFQGAAVFGAAMDLTGGGYALLSDVGAAVSSAACKAIGYRLGDRAYAYVYDQSYNLDNQAVSTKSNVTLTIPGMTPGTYVVCIYDTFSGAILAQSSVVVGAGGSFQTSLPAFTADLAVSVERTAG